MNNGSRLKRRHQAVGNRNSWYVDEIDFYFFLNLSNAVDPHQIYNHTRV